MAWYGSAVLVVSASLWDPSDAGVKLSVMKLAELTGNAFWAPTLFRAVILLQVGWAAKKNF
jgi:hypothetical protein